MKKKQKKAPLLLTEDISMEPEQERRSQAVRRCSARLAQRLGTSIDVVHVEDVAFYPVTSAFYRPLIQKFFSAQKTQLAEVAKSIPVPAHAMFLNGDPVRRILSLSSKRGAYEAIVLGTHGRRGLGRLLLGSIAEEVVRGSSIPVITVGPKAQEEGARFLEGQKGLKILVATGLTANSDRAEEYAVKLAKRLGAELVLFHSLHDSLHPVLQTAFAGADAGRQLGGLLDQLKADALKAIKAKAARLKKTGAEVTFALDTKMITSTEAVLKEAASRSVDLIVMGTHGRTLAAGTFFGRTARGVILESPVPVVTVRSRGR